MPQRPGAQQSGDIGSNSSIRMPPGSHQRRQRIHTDASDPVHHQGANRDLSIAKIGNQEGYEVAAKLVGVLDPVPELLFILTLQDRVDRGLEDLAVLAALRDHQGGDPQELDSDTRHAGVLAADHAIDLGNRGLLNKIGDLVIGRILRESFLKFGDGGIDVAFLELGEALLQQAILILGDRAGERSK